MTEKLTGFVKKKPKYHYTFLKMKKLETISDDFGSHAFKPFPFGK